MSNIGGIGASGAGFAASFNAAPSMKLSAGSAQNKEREAGSVSEESGAIKMPEVKVAHSEKEAIRNRIESLREQIKTLDEADDIDAETKRKAKEQITQQISDLNTQLLDVERREAEKQREKESSGKADSTRRFDRYEPSEALDKATSEGMKNVIDAQVSLDKVKTHFGNIKGMQQRTDILSNEVKLDIKSGASTKEKEEEIADLKSKIRGAGAKLDNDIKDANEKAEPTYLTYDGGLAWLDELRQKRAEAKAAEARKAEEANEAAPADTSAEALKAGQVGDEASGAESLTQQNGAIAGVKLTKAEEQINFADTLKARVSITGKAE